MLKVLLEMLVAIAAIAMYLLPAILADRTKRRSVLLLALFNLLFGWTVVGWFAALYWAFNPDSARRLGRVAKKNRQAAARHTVDAIVSRAQARGARRAGIEFAHGAARGGSE
jgi:membrane glycosyltransferase